MGLPPFDAGGVKLMVAWALPGIAVPMIGAPGTVAALVTKMAVTLREALSGERVQLSPVVASQPVKDCSIEPTAGLAVSTTALPGVKLALHVPGQAMPAGADATVPAPLTVRLIDGLLESPVPMRLELRVGLMVSLPVTVRVALRAPTPPGVNVIVIVHVAAGSKALVGVQVPVRAKSAGFVPAMVIAERLSVDIPLIANGHIERSGRHANLTASQVQC